MTDNEDLSKFFDFIPRVVSQRVNGTQYLNKKREWVGTWDGKKLKKNCCYTEKKWGFRCDKYAKRPTNYCIRHGGGIKCRHTEEDGTPCGKSIQHPLKYCKKHGKKKSCHDATVEDRLNIVETND